MRRLIITEPTAERHIWMFNAVCTTLWNGGAWEPYEYLSNLVPQNLPAGTRLDNSPHWLNSYYWDPAQSVGIPTDLVQMTTNHFNKARMRHWLDYDATYGVDHYLAQVSDWPVSRLESFTWLNGRVRTHTDPRGLTVTKTWDALDRLTLESYPDSTTVEYSYHNHGLLITVTGPAGLEQQIGYNLLDQPTTVTDPNGVTLTQSFDWLGRVSSRNAPDGGIERFLHSARGLGQGDRFVADDPLSEALCRRLGMGQGAWPK